MSAIVLEDQLLVTLINVVKHELKDFSLRIWEYLGRKFPEVVDEVMVSVKACVARNAWHPHWFHFEAIKTCIFLVSFTHH